MTRRHFIQELVLRWSERRDIGEEETAARQACKLADAVHAVAPFDDDPGYAAPSDYERDRAERRRLGK